MSKAAQYILSNSWKKTHFIHTVLKNVFRTMVNT